MKPAPFDYAAPPSLAAALALKAEHGDEAKFLAGGQSLVPAMNFRLVQAALQPVGNSPEQFGAVIKSEIERWTKVALDLGIKPE